MKTSRKPVWNQRQPAPRLPRADALLLRRRAPAGQERVRDGARGGAAFVALHDAHGEGVRDGEGGAGDCGRDVGARREWVYGGERHPEVVERCYGGEVSKRHAALAARTDLLDQDLGGHHHCTVA